MIGIEIRFFFSFFLGTLDITSIILYLREKKKTLIFLYLREKKKTFTF
jgi:hypothetical protein